MLSYRVLEIATFLMAWSIGCALLLFLTRFKLVQHPKFYTYGSAVLFVLNIAVLVFLLFGKERFHWHFDIATGAPVDHYSTYGRCLAFTITGLLANLLAVVFRTLNLRKPR